MADENKNESGDASSGPESPVPEVEAEIVDDADADSAAAGFDDGGDRAAETPAPEAARKSTLTPGVVLFLAFAAFALIAFALWRLQSGGAGEVETAEPEAPVRAAPDDAPKASEAPAAESRTDAGKIANDAAAAVKRSPGVVDPVADVPSADDTFLPPLPGEGAAGANRRLQETAKEAARQFGPEAQNAPAPAPGDIEGFEIDDGAAGAESDVEDATSGEAPSGAQGFGDAAAGKIDNAELAALKDSFRAETQRLSGALADERARTAALGEEIAAMRRDFEAALAARDERADAEIEDLRAALEKIRNGDDLTAAKRAAGAAAFAALETAAESDRPFAAELDLVARIVPDAAPLGTLRRYAETGTDALDALKEDFGVAAREGLAAAGREQAGGFWPRLGARAQSLVSVRPASPRAGPGPGAAISRAEAAVENGDLAGAIAEIETLPAGAQAAMQDWTDKARTRAEIDGALDALGALLLAPVEG